MRFTYASVRMGIMGLVLMVGACQAAVLELGSGLRLEVPFDGSAWMVRDMEGDVVSRLNGLMVVNGRTDTAMDLALVEAESFSGGAVLTYKDSMWPAVTIRTHLAEMEPGYLAVTVEAANETEEQIWLDVQLRLGLTGASEWYDGYEVKTGEGARHVLWGTLPFGALYGGGRGLGIGLAATELVSRFGSRMEMAGSLPTLTFSSHVVVDPGSHKQRRYIVFGFDPDFEYRNALSAYYRFFPHQFTMAPGVDPDTAGPSLGGLWWRTQNRRYFSSGIRNDKITDVLRWMGGSWDWCYLGYGYRPGDWLMTEALSGDWVLDTSDGKKTFREHYGMSAAEYLQVNHLDAFDQADRFHIAPMMYIIPNYVEIELAQTQFPDSIYYDEQGRFRSSGPPWVTSFDRSVQVYPYGNSFGDYTLAALPVIVGRSNIKGFAFDCIDRARFNYFGPGVERSPGRGFDPGRGVFANSETAHALFGRAVHEQERDGVRMALTGNVRGSTGSYLTAFAMDAAMIEHSPWDDRPEADVVRNLMGQKSITFWRGYGRLPGIEGRDAESLLDMATTLADFSVLKALQYGMYLNFRYIIGSPMMIYYNRIFNDLFRNYGWEPVPAVRGDPALWLTRYGPGMGGVVAAGNPSSASVSTSMAFSAEYFAADSVAFVDYEGLHPVVNTVAGGTTTVEETIPRGKARLFQAGLHWLHGEVSGTIEGLRESGHGEPIRDLFRIHVTRPARSAQLAVSVLPGHALTSVRWNGENIPYSQEKNRMVFTVPQAHGENQLSLVYTPEIGVADTAFLTSVQLLNGEKEPQVRICLEREDPVLRRAGERIVNFLSNYVFGPDDPEQVLDIPITVGTAGENPGQGWILYVGSAEGLSGTPLQGRPRVFPVAQVDGTGTMLAVTGDAPEAVSRGVDLLLDRLQDRYPFFGYFQLSSGSVPADARTLRHSLFQHVTGKDYLPWQRD